MADAPKYSASSASMAGTPPGAPIDSCHCVAATQKKRVAGEDSTHGLDLREADASILNWSFVCSPSLGNRQCRNRLLASREGFLGIGNGGIQIAQASILQSVDPAVHD